MFAKVRVKSQCKGGVTRLRSGVGGPDSGIESALVNLEGIERYTQMVYTVQCAL